MKTAADTGDWVVVVRNCMFKGAFEDVRSDVVIYIKASTKKSFNKAKKKLLNAGLPTTAKVVWTKIKLQT